MQLSLASLWTDLAQALSLFVLMACLFVPLELVFNLRPSAFPRRHFWADVGFFFLNSIVPAMLVVALVGCLVFLVRPLYSSGIFAWVGSLPLWLKFSLAIIVGDVGAYWGHRWSHEVPLLWYFHKLHHEAEHIDWLVTNRAHPFDTAFLKISGLVLIYLCGFAQGSLGQGTLLMSVYALTVTTWAFLVHANVNWRFGILEKWLASPAFHHWHHSNESRDSIDKNYAAIFPWIDRVFGTYYLPSRRWPSSCGLKVLDSLGDEVEQSAPGKPERVAHATPSEISCHDA